jgi:hypothetical protein
MPSKKVLSMGTRGRTSAASLSVISSPRVETVRRAEPPTELTDEQASEWIAIVTRLPADWFPRETYGMLAQYCRHVVSARRVAQLIAECEASDSFDVEDYDRLLKMQEREGRALSSLATRMRLSQQTTYDKSKKKPGPSRKPWES